MTGFKRVFFDTAPFVYLLDVETPYTKSMEAIMVYLNSRDIKLITSVITVAEYLVFPYRENVPQKVQSFFSFIEDNDIDIMDADMGLAEHSAKLRAQYHGFKGMDALQLAAAHRTECDVFLTNDKQLCQCREVNCILVDDFKKLLEV